MSYLLGVDAGNTKTIALVAQSDGAILGAGRSGCGDIYAAGAAAYGVPEAALDAVAEAVTTALREAGVRPEQLAVGSFSMAGADWPEDYALLQAGVERYGFGRAVVIVNDAIGALRAGSPDGCGVSVVCGTGIATGARAPDGRTWHHSFWQEPNGSSYLSELALRAVCRAELGIDPPTSLTARVLSFFAMSSVEEVLHAFSARGVQRPANVRGLARLLLDEAAVGDATAMGIAEAQGAMLGDYALAAARKVGIEHTAFPLVLAGGVLRHPSRILVNAIIARVRATAPDAQPVFSRFEPAVGALLLAFDAAGSATDEALLARMSPTLPPHSFFAT